MNVNIVSITSMNERETDLFTLTQINGLSQTLVTFAALLKTLHPKRLKILLLRAEAKGNIAQSHLVCSVLRLRRPLREFLFAKGGNEGEKVYLLRVLRGWSINQ